MDHVDQGIPNTAPHVSRGVSHCTTLHDPGIVICDIYLSVCTLFDCLLVAYLFIEPFYDTKIIIMIFFRQRKSREESQGKQSGIEIVENRPYEDGPGGSGQYTKKIYHIAGHVPQYIKSRWLLHFIIVLFVSWYIAPAVQFYTRVLLVQIILNPVYLFFKIYTT